MKFPMKRLFLFLSFFLFVQFAAAQFNSQRLDEYFDILEQNDKFNGTVALADNGKIIYQRAVGYSDYDTGKKNDLNTVFRVGSVSKTFTATLILKAMEEGKLNLDDKLAKWFPGVPNAEKISIADLGTHRSGIHNFTSDPDYFTYHYQPKTGAELVEIISGYDSDFEPGSRSEYSNSNYVLLSLILENVYGKSFAELLKEKITQPLGLENTSVGGKIDPSKNQASSWNYGGSWQKQGETDLSIPLGAGNIISTSPELIAFGQALTTGKIISAESLELMKNLDGHPGIGLFPTPFNEKLGYGHSGGIDSFSAFWGYFPEEKLSIAYTSNGTDINTNDMLIVMLSAYWNEPFELPEFVTSEDVVEPGITGVFSNSRAGMKITIFEYEGQLAAQAEGQMPFPLKEDSEGVYSFEAAGIIIEFAEDQKSFTLKQGGMDLVFLKVE